MTLKETGCEDLDWIQLVQDIGSSGSYELWVSFKLGEFLGQLRGCKLLKKDYPSWNLLI
jgi:hypothetical protein